MVSPKYCTYDFSHTPPVRKRQHRAQHTHSSSSSTLCTGCLSCRFEIVHVTGCALGEKATTDRHVVKAIPTDLEGKALREVALGTLVRDRTDQFAVDFGVSRTTGFRHTGSSTVYLSGYLTRSYASEFGSDEFDDMDDSDDEDEDEEEDDSDEEVPDAIPMIPNGVPKVM